MSSLCAEFVVMLCQVSTVLFAVCFAGLNSAELAVCPKCWLSKCAVCQKECSIECVLDVLKKLATVKTIPLV